MGGRKLFQAMFKLFHSFSEPHYFSTNTLFMTKTWLFSVQLGKYFGFAFSLI